VQNTLGYKMVITAETEAETRSKDCYWYSPVLNKRLESRRASAAVRLASGSELKAVFAIAYRNDLPVTVRGGATGN
jgi:FAD/FMN-containing dehydrogenase